MSNLTIFAISGSALTAQYQRMNVAASNLANAESVDGPNGQHYKAPQVVCQMQTIEAQHRVQAVGGVRVSQVVESNAPHRMEYNPGHPMANENGYIVKPNVDVVAETVNMISASRSYQANVEVINTAKSLMNRTLTIGQ